MTELNANNESGMDSADPLSGAASGWEAPKYPVLAGDRICVFKILACKKEPVADKPDREKLTIVLSTEKDYTDDEGKPLRAGFKVHHNVSITPTEESDTKRARTWKNIGEDLSMILKAAGLGDRSPRALITDPSIIEDRIVECRVGIRKETAEFPKSNTIKFRIPDEN